MITVLFVCLGNICRSPMAEAMFRDLVKREGLENTIQVDSAGTGDWHIGHPPHKGTREILKKYEIADQNLVARQITKEDLEQFDYIIAMDEENVKNICKLAASSLSHTKVKRLLEYAEDIEDKNVPDPYFTGNFEQVYHLLLNSCQKLLEEMKGRLKES